MHSTAATSHLAELYVKRMRRFNLAYFTKEFAAIETSGDGLSLPIPPHQSKIRNPRQEFSPKASDAPF
jgi:hypothetical protein